MQVPIQDYASARAHMVDGQLRPNRVSDRRLLEVLRELPRERFLAEPLRPLADIYEDLPLGGGRVLMEPLVLARLLQLARARPGERVLIVGAGVGYGAAVLSRCGADVIGLEEVPALLAAARYACGALAPGVNLVAGRLAAMRPSSSKVRYVQSRRRLSASSRSLTGGSSPSLPRPDAPSRPWSPRRPQPAS